MLKRRRISVSRYAAASQAPRCTHQCCSNEQPALTDWPVQPFALQPGKCRVHLSSGSVAGTDEPLTLLWILTVAEADLAIVLGSSMRVSPANSLPQMTAENGKPLVVINLQRTPLDPLCTLRIFAKTDEVNSGDFLKSTELAC